MLLSPSGPSKRFVGRTEALTKLAQWAQCPQLHERPSVALVSGDAGVGKTRLLYEFLADLDLQTTVLVGQAHDGDAARPYRLVRDLAEDVSPAGQVPEALERWRHPVEHLLEPTVAPADHPADGHRHTAEELCRAGVAIVEHLVGDAPGVIVLEDLHWADAESLEFVRRLAHSRIKALLIATFRPEAFERTHALARLLTDLGRHPGVEGLTVEGFTKSELAEFLEQVYGQPVQTTVVDRIHARTLGNPFFIEELIGARGTDDSDDPADLEKATLPWSTREAVLRTLARFEERTFDVATTAAALGSTFDLQLLEGVTGSTTGELVPHLRELVRAGTVVERGGGAFSFRHALTWEATAGELFEAEHRIVHERAIQVLDADGCTDDEQLAYHARHAGQLERAARHARAAASRAAHQGAPRHALLLADLAQPHYPDDRDLASLSASAAAQIGQFTEAVDHARRWMELAEEAGDHAEYARAGCQLAWFAWWAGDERAGEALAAAADVAVEQDDLRLAAEVAIAQARLLHAEQQVEDATARARDALRLAQRAGHDSTLAKAQLIRAASIIDDPAQQRSGDLAHAAKLMDQARHTAADRRDLETLVVALHNRLVPDQPDDLPIATSFELLEQAHTLADRYGLERFAHKLGVIEVHLLVVAGRLEDAEAALSAALRAPLPPAEASWRASLDAYLKLERGDIERAEAVHDQQLQLTGGPFAAEAMMDCAWTSALIAASTTDPERAGAALRDAGLAIASVCPCVAARWWEIALAALDAGVGADDVRRFLREQAPEVLPRHEALAQHLHGVLLIEAGNHPHGLAALRDAAGRARHGRRATQLADVDIRLAEALALEGARAEARQHIRSALDHLARWPGAARERVEGVRKRLGDGDTTPHEIFTPREVEVVRLLASGYTDAEIGERLYITRKTASTHVSNILAKTSFSRRTQVATWAVQTGIVKADQTDR